MPKTKKKIKKPQKKKGIIEVSKGKVSGKKTATEIALNKKRPVGRPLKFEDLTAGQLEDRSDAYFESCYEKYMAKIFVGKKRIKAKKGGYYYRNKYKLVNRTRLIRPPTITGFALFLGMTSRKQLLEYQETNKKSKEFRNTIKKGKFICENFAEEYLFTGKNVTGAIFNLKNNYENWKDKKEVGVSGKLSLSDLFDAAKKKEKKT